MHRYIPVILVSATLVLYWVWDRHVAHHIPTPVETVEHALGTASGADGEMTVEPGPAPVQVTHGAISRGESFFVAMQQAGVSPVNIDQIVRSTRKVFNFRRIQPGQSYAIYRNPEGVVDSLHFAINNESLLKIIATEESYAARIDTIPYRIEHYVTSGTIDGSIFNTLQAKEADPELATYLAIIFQWDIDFFKDIWRGDTFAILYERKVYEDGEQEPGRVLAARITTQGRDHYAFGYRTGDGVWSYYDANGKSLQKSLLRAPLRYSRISSSFSNRRLHPVTHRYKPHHGVDYAAPYGTPVRATGSGTVLVAQYHSGNGNYVKIRHNSRYTTYYLHLSKFARGVRKGARVNQGQVIGYVGSTGISTGPHLDYRIKVGGSFVNPRTIRLPSKQPVPAGDFTLFEQTRDACLVSLIGALPESRVTLVEKPRPPQHKRLAGMF